MTVLATLYAIRQKGTLKFLPNTATNRGHTYSEPVAGPQPRLFDRRRSAAVALKAWAKGHATPIMDIDYGEFGERYDSQRGVDYSPVEGRNADDMEIVEVTLVLAP